MEIDGCNVCDPIRKLVEQFIARKYHITIQRVDDPHFRQVYIEVVGPKISDLPSVEGVIKVEKKYICDCHWSSVKYDFDH